MTRALVRTRSPFSEMNRLAREMDTLFGGLTSTGSLWSPPVDVEEVGDDLVLSAELPGLAREDIEIELEDGVLTISGEKTASEKAEGTNGLLYERRWGSFTRKFTLPRAVDPDGIRASLEDGILTVRVPKAEEARGRKIQITAGDNGREVGSP